MTFLGSISEGFRGHQLHTSHAADVLRIFQVAPRADVAENHGLRIDHCESCSAYLKTYAGQGDEAILLADWTSLHLDIAARERGWHRMAASLYDLDGRGDRNPLSRRGSGNPEASAVQ